MAVAPWDIPQVQDASLKVAFLNILTTYVWHKPDYNKEKFAHYNWEKRHPAIIELIGRERPAVLGLCELDLTHAKTLQGEMQEGKALAGYQLLGYSAETEETIEATKRFEDHDWKQYGEFVAFLVDTNRVEVTETRCHRLPSDPGQRWNRILVEARLVDKASQRTFAFLVSHFDHEKREARDRSARFELGLIEAFEKEGTPWIAVGDRNWPPETGEQESHPYGTHPAVVDVRDETRLGCFGLSGTFIRKMQPMTVDMVDTGYRSSRLTDGEVYYTRTGKYDPLRSRLVNDDAKTNQCVSDHLMFVTAIRLTMKGKV